MRILITGGGTGGHTSPAVAVLQELQERDPRLVVQWIGRRGNIEQRICEAMTIPFRSVPVVGWPRGSRLGKPWAALRLAWAIVRAWMYIRRFNPQVVFGVGGYVSLPAMWAAQRMGKATALHEQNQLLGMANRISAPRARRIFLSFPNTKGCYPSERAKVVGNPVRAGFRHPLSPPQARAKLALAEGVPTVLVCGGSQGAHRLNAAIAALLAHVRPDELQLLWMTGNADFAAARQAAMAAPVRVEVFAFIEDMPTACAAADLIVSRAGASSTAELAMLGRPSVLVPYPHAAENHQEENARAFEAAGAAIVLQDSECTPERMLSVLRELLGDPGRLEAMGQGARTLAHPAAAEVIAEELLALAFGAEPIAPAPPEAGPPEAGAQA